MRAAAAANIAKLKVAAGGKEVMAFGYLMPDGRIEVRLAEGTAGNLKFSGHPSGPGKVIFGIHGHPSDDGSDGMVDDPGKNGKLGTPAHCSRAAFRWRPSITARSAGMK
jgi:hypothetical protein